MGAIHGLRIEGPNETGDGGLGPYVRGGVRLNDLLGIEDDVAVATALIPLFGLSVLVRDTLDLTVTPVDWLTLGAGPMGSWGVSESAWTVGGTMRVDLHFPHQRAASGARRAWTLGIAGDLADVVKRNGPAGSLAWGGFLTFGYAWY